MEDVAAVVEQGAEQLNWLPDWAVSLLLFACAIAIPVAVHGAIFRRLQRKVENRSLFWRSLVQRTQGPSRLALLIFTLGVAIAAAPLPEVAVGALRHGLLIATMVLIGWTAVTALHIWTVVYMRRFKLDAEDNQLARKHATQISILKRAGVTLAFVVTLAAALMTFDSVRQYGVSLLASAGAAGLILGLAMQPVLANLVAGIQLAITQPIRLEDAIVVENEWGWVEEITSTYVVVRLWDWRRLVLPLRYFIENPFQNWTRDGASIIGTVMIYVDHSAPIAVMREKLEELVAESPLWDGQVVNLQVSDAKEFVIEVRLLVSAGTSPKVWDLRCEMREKMITWLNAEHPYALPRHRADVSHRAPAPAAEMETRPVFRQRVPKRSAQQEPA
ncbi:mechanosensitive ion channel family protein [Chenggangzhangella methanolivorans]|uniref:Mechanosensitive ion channel family protein n=1 Tax=Chenggangzhangella methanolivorans TaxID=1437009 RepID=A0A9E6REC2_9HYPH|nr:mechanosensitive ion channel family protein [Chenggangzhangella methanolivorans]QZO01884.1 mechanosensitive ion channel family protein [Chenggangzhangella methanolivorans]